MSSQFTGTFVLDDSQAQSTIAKTNRQLGDQENQIKRNKHRLDTYFQWAMHFANIWAGYMTRNLEGTAKYAQYQAVAQNLNIVSAELSIALITKRALADLATGTPVGIAAGVAQLAIAGSMQFILIEMQGQKKRAESHQKDLENARAFFDAYR